MKKKKFMAVALSAAMVASTLAYAGSPVSTYAVTDEGYFGNVAAGNVYVELLEAESHDYKEMLEADNTLTSAAIFGSQYSEAAAYGKVSRIEEDGMLDDKTYYLYTGDGTEPGDAFVADEYFVRVGTDGDLDYAAPPANTADGTKPYTAYLALNAGFNAENAVNKRVTALSYSTLTPIVADSEAEVTMKAALAEAYVDAVEAKYDVYGTTDNYIFTTEAEAGSGTNLSYYNALQTADIQGGVAGAEAQPNKTYLITSFKATTDATLISAYDNAEPNVTNENPFIHKVVAGAVASTDGVFPENDTVNAIYYVPSAIVEVSNWTALSALDANDSLEVGLNASTELNNTSSKVYDYWANAINKFLEVDTTSGYVTIDGDNYSYAVTKTMTLDGKTWQGTLSSDDRINPNGYDALKLLVGRVPVESDYQGTASTKSYTIKSSTDETIQTLVLRAAKKILGENYVEDGGLGNIKKENVTRTGDGTNTPYQYWYDISSVIVKSAALVDPTGIRVRDPAVTYESNDEWLTRDLTLTFVDATEAYKETVATNLVETNYGTNGGWSAGEYNARTVDPARGYVTIKTVGDESNYVTKNDVEGTGVMTGAFVVDNSSEDLSALSDVSLTTALNNLFAGTTPDDDSKRKFLAYDQNLSSITAIADADGTNVKTLNVSTGIPTGMEAIEGLSDAVSTLAQPYGVTLNKILGGYVINNGNLFIKLNDLEESKITDENVAVYAKVFAPDATDEQIAAGMAAAAGVADPVNTGFAINWDTAANRGLNKVVFDIKVDANGGAVGGEVLIRRFAQWYYLVGPYTIEVTGNAVGTGVTYDGEAISCGPKSNLNPSDVMVDVGGVVDLDFTDVDKAIGTDGKVGNVCIKYGAAGAINTLGLPTNATETDKLVAIVAADFSKGYRETTSDEAALKIKKKAITETITYTTKTLNVNLGATAVGEIEAIANKVDLAALLEDYLSGDDSLDLTLNCTEDTKLSTMSFGVGGKSTVIAKAGNVGNYAVLTAGEYVFTNAAIDEKLLNYTIPAGKLVITVPILGDDVEPIEFNTGTVQKAINKNEELIYTNNVNYIIAQAIVDNDSAAVTNIGQVDGGRIYFTTDLENFNSDNIQGQKVECNDVVALAGSDLSNVNWTDANKALFGETVPAGTYTVYVKAVNGTDVVLGATELTVTVEKAGIAVDFNDDYEYYIDEGATERAAGSIRAVYTGANDEIKDTTGYQLTYSYATGRDAGDPISDEDAADMFGVNKPSPAAFDGDTYEGVAPDYDEENDNEYDISCEADALQRGSLITAVAKNYKLVYSENPTTITVTPMARDIELDVVGGASDKETKNTVSVLNGSTVILDEISAKASVFENEDLSANDYPRYGDLITVVVDDANEDYKFVGDDSISIQYYDDSAKKYVDVKDVDGEDGEYTFTMPAGKVAIDVIFNEYHEFDIYNDGEDGDISSLSTEIVEGSVKVDGVSTDVLKAAVGQTVTFNITNRDDYREKDSFALKIYDENGGNISTLTNLDYKADDENEGQYIVVFTMPDKAAYVSTTYVPVVDVVVEYASGSEVAGNTIYLSSDNTKTPVILRESYEGEKLEFGVTNAEGYEFLEAVVTYTEGGEEVNTYSLNKVTGKLKFNVPEDDITVTLKWKKTSYTVTVIQPDEGGTVVSNFTPNASVDDAVKVTVTPDTGYDVNGVYVYDAAAYDAAATPEAIAALVPIETITEIDQGTYNFTMPAQNVVIVADVAKKKNNIVLNDAYSYYFFGAKEVKDTDVLNSYKVELYGDNKVYQDDIANVDYGTEVTVTASPAEGYMLDIAGIEVYTGTGEDIKYVEGTPDGNTFTFNMPAEAVTIDVTFTAITMDITISIEGNGSISLEDDEDRDWAKNAVDGDVIAIPVGIELTPGAKAASGYDWDDIILVNGEKFEGDTITVAENTTVGAVFTPQPFNITILGSGTYGTVTAKVGKNVVGKAKTGDLVTLDIVPLNPDNKKYKVSSVTVITDTNSKEVKFDYEDYTFTMPGDAVNVTVVFTECESHAIAKSASDNRYTISKTTAYEEDTVYITLDTTLIEQMGSEFVPSTEANPNPYYMIAGDDTKYPVTGESAGLYSFVVPSTEGEAENITVYVEFKDKESTITVANGVYDDEVAKAFVVTNAKNETIGTFTVSSESKEADLVDASSTVDANDNITVKVTPVDNTWDVELTVVETATENEVKYTYDEEKGGYVFNVNKKNVTITVEFVKKKIKATFDSTVKDNEDNVVGTITVSNDNGAVESGKTEFELGSLLTIKAEPKPGYRLKENSLVINGATHKDNLEADVYEVNADANAVTIAAQFEEAKAFLSVDNSEANATLTVQVGGQPYGNNPVKEVDKDTVITVAAVAKKGSHKIVKSIDLLDFNNEPLNTGLKVENGQFAMPDYNVIISVTLEDEPMYTLTTSPAKPEQGDDNYVEVVSVYGSGETEAEEFTDKAYGKSTVNVKAVPKDVNYELTKLSYTYSDEDQEYPLNFVYDETNKVYTANFEVKEMPAPDANITITITGTFALKNNTIVVSSADENVGIGTVEVQTKEGEVYGDKTLYSDIDEYAATTPIKMTFTAPQYYELKSIKLNDEDPITDKNFIEFNMTATQPTVYVTYEKISNKVSLSNMTHGTLEVYAGETKLDFANAEDGKVAVDAGTVLTVKAKGDTGYVLDGSITFTVEAVDVVVPEEGDTTYTVNGKGNVEFGAAFKMEEYSATWAATTGGTMGVYNSKNQPVTGNVKFKYGDELTVSANPTLDTDKVEKVYYVLEGEEEETVVEPNNDGKYIILAPASNITVGAIFSPITEADIAEAAAEAAIEDAADAVEAAKEAVDALGENSTNEEISAAADKVEDAKNAITTAEDALKAAKTAGVSSEKMAGLGAELDEVKGDYADVEDNLVDAVKDVVKDAVAAATAARQDLTAEKIAAADLALNGEPETATLYGTMGANDLYDQLKELLDEADPSIKEMDADLNGDDDSVGANNDLKAAERIAEFNKAMDAAEAALNAQNPDYAKAAEELAKAKEAADAVRTNEPNNDKEVPTMGAAMVDAVKGAINALPDAIDLGNEAQVNGVRGLYSALADKDQNPGETSDLQGKVTNLKDLEDAEAAVVASKNEVEAVKNAIDAIPDDVTAEGYADKVRAAQVLRDGDETSDPVKPALSAAEKDAVGADKNKKLDDAINALDNAEAAAPVIKAINELPDAGDIVEDDAIIKAVNDAKNAYGNLDTAQQAIVDAATDNHAKLDAADGKLNDIAKAKEDAGEKVANANKTAKDANEKVDPAPDEKDLKAIDDAIEAAEGAILAADIKGAKDDDVEALEKELEYARKTAEKIAKGLGQDYYALTLKVEPEEGGTAYFNVDAENVREGTEVRVIAAANDGYVIKAIEVNEIGYDLHDLMMDEEKLPGLKYTTFTVAENAKDVVVKFAKLVTPTVQVSEDSKDMGLATIEPATEVPAGTEVTVVATPKEGYEVAAIKIGDASLEFTVDETTGAGTAKFNVSETENNAIVYFQEKSEEPVVETYTATVNVNDATMGSAIVDPAEAVAAGTSITVTAKANDGYKVQSIKVGELGYDLIKNDDGTVSVVFEIAADTVVTVNFEAESVEPEPGPQPAEKTPAEKVAEAFENAEKAAKDAEAAVAAAKVNSDPAAIKAVDDAEAAYDAANSEYAVGQVLDPSLKTKANDDKIAAIGSQIMAAKGALQALPATEPTPGPNPDEPTPGPQPEAEKFAITTVAEPSYAGTAAASATSSVSGNTITLTATVVSGYTFTGWKVVDANGNDIVVSNATALTATFVMPESNVVATASFAVNSGKDDRSSKGSGSSSSGSGSSSGSSSGSTSGGSSSGTTSTTTTTPSPTTTGSPVTIKNSDGTTASGVVKAQSPDGKVKLATVGSGDSAKDVMVDADGNPLRSSVVSIDDKTYLTDADGNVLKTGFYRITAEDEKNAGDSGLKEGDLVYATKDGSLKKGEVFKVSGHRYNAGENGKIVTNDFWTTALGNKVYSNDNGRIVTKKLFTAVPDGKKYYAVKSGKIVSGKTITWKGVDYDLDSKGVATKA